MGSTSGREQPAEGAHHHRPALAAPHPPGISPGPTTSPCSAAILRPGLLPRCSHPGCPSREGLANGGDLGRRPARPRLGGGGASNAWGVQTTRGARLKHYRRGRGGGVDGLQGASCCPASRGEGWGLWLSASPSPQPEPAPPSQPAHLPPPPAPPLGTRPWDGRTEGWAETRALPGKGQPVGAGAPRSPQLTFHLPHGLLRPLLVDSVQPLLFLLCSLSLRQSPSAHILEIYLRSRGKDQI